MFKFLKSLWSKKKTVPNPAPSDAHANGGLLAASCVAATHQTSAPPVSSGESIELPLASILDQIPEEVKAGIRTNRARHERVPIALKAVLDQLPQGRVRISLRELKQMTSPDLFAPLSEQDDLLIDLPLRAILDQIKPNRLLRRPGQKQMGVEISEAANSLFGPRNRHLCPPQSRPPTEEPVPEPAAVPSETSPPLPQIFTRTDDNVLVLPMAALRGAWPESVTQNLSQMDLQKTVLAVPLAELERGLARGKVEFTWRQLLSWMMPALPPEGSLTDGSQRLELPLQIVAPAFLARHKPPPARKPSGAITVEIPDLFGTPAPAGRVTAGDPTPAYASSGAFSSPPAPVLSEPMPEMALEFGEIFGQPDKRTWSPIEIVDRTARLPGIAGALLATLDGLLIASRWPSEVCGERVAAFVPMMYGRLAQYAKELKLGEPGHLTFHIEEIPLQVFKTGRLHFALLGRANEPLPRAQLAAIAAALARPSQPA